MIDKYKIFTNLNPQIQWLKDKTIFLTIQGSISHGLNTSESDVDIRGMAICPKEYMLGFNSSFEQFIINEPTDCAIFELKKFFKLTSQGNPNSIEILFTEPQFHLHTDDLGKILLDNRDKFISKQLKERYVGYAKAQAHRISQHRKFLLNPPTKKPTRSSCGLSEKIQIDKNQFDVIKALINKKINEWTPSFEEFSESQKIYLQSEIGDILSEMKITNNSNWMAAARTIGLNENLIEIIKKEKEFDNQVEEFKNYENWKKNRNPKRAELEAKFGYDLKHGTALLRLMRMGKEILDTGKVNVMRTDDKDELMAIKKGAWSYERLIQEVDKTSEEVKISYKNSKLPNQPDIKYLDNLCINLIDKSLSKHSLFNIKKHFKGLLT